MLLVMLLLLRQQRIQLVDELVEQLQRLVDGSRSGHIHTGQLQQVDRVGMEQPPDRNLK